MAFSDLRGIRIRRAGANRVNYRRHPLMSFAPRSEYDSAQPAVGLHTDSHRNQ